MNSNRINVTKTFLPSQNEYQKILSRSWDKNWITNRGELLVELETKLSQYLGVDDFFITTNGTLPIQIAIKALGLNKEIITTPFSYVATTSSIVWENCKPVFVDIEENTLTVDVSKIEAAINDNTEAILVTHVFGNPCDVDAIEIIANKHGLKVIYDAAHCFGVNYKGKSLFSYGDVSTCSFHATKLFHTGEGGAFFANSPSLKEKAYYHHNFGHNGPENFYGLGINAKASEMQAAMGLAVFPNLPEIIAKRKELTELYEALLIESSSIKFVTTRKEATKNFSYMPVIFNSEDCLLRVIKELNRINIFPRRYFYPSLNTLDYLSEYESMPISENISKRILCLPLYYDLKKTEVEIIVSKILDIL